MGDNMEEKMEDFTKLSHLRIAERVKRLLKTDAPPTATQLENETATIESDIAAFVVYKIHFRKLRREHYQEINRAADNILKHLGL
jgi:hypothetical protein